MIKGIAFAVLTRCLVIAPVAIISGQCHAAGMKEDAIKKECAKLPKDYSE
jgi:hypothetical protein